MITNEALIRLQHTTKEDITDFIYENNYINPNIFTSEFFGIENELAVFEIELYNLDDPLKFYFEIDPETGILLKHIKTSR